MTKLTGALDAFWPLELKEEWDAVGLVLGQPERRIAKLLLTVDVTPELLSEAQKKQVDLIIAHHPLLFKSVRTLPETSLNGYLVAELIRSDIALYTAHTNADVVAGGTSDAIATRLGLLNTTPIIDSGSGVGLGRVGELAKPISLGEFAHLISGILPATAAGVQVSGKFDAPVTKVSICAGAGDGLLEHPAVMGSDVYLTSDLRHHPSLEIKSLREIGKAPFLVNTSHWASEWFFLNGIASKLGEMFPNLHIEVSDLNTDPWDFVITQ